LLPAARATDSSRGPESQAATRAWSIPLPIASGNSRGELLRLVNGHREPIGITVAELHRIRTRYQRMSQILTI
jgi:hypothetical protein